MNKLDKITIAMDMAGCPNRCKHCWLGTAPNGRMQRKEMIWTAEAFKPFADKFEIISWYREPDYRDDYKELWDLECLLSDDKTPHFELMSYWRMVRDEEYANWLYSLGVRKCQLTLFGPESVTDYYVGRPGAYKEIIKSIDIMIKHGIAPRIQVFVNKDNIEETKFVEELVLNFELEGRCRDINQEFHMFVHQGSCDGENEKLYNIRITEEDLCRIPRKLIDATLKHFNKNSIEDVFGISEKMLISELLNDKTTMSLVSASPVFYIDSNFNVFPNYTQPSEWWCLGNLKTNGAEVIMDKYMNNRSKAQNYISNVTISEMVSLYGNFESKRLFTKEDYIIYIQNQYCKEKC